MSDAIETAVIEITPDFTGFATTLRAKLRMAQSSAPEVKLKVKADQSIPAINSLRTSIKKVISGATKGLDTSINIKPKLDLTVLNKQLARLHNKTVVINVRYKEYNRPTPIPPPGTGGSGGGGGTGSGNVSAQDTAHAAALAEADRRVRTRERAAVQRRRNEIREMNAFHTAALAQEKRQERLRERQERTPRRRGAFGGGGGDDGGSNRWGGSDGVPGNFGKGTIRAARNRLIALAAVNIAPITAAVVGLSSSLAVAGAGLGLFGIAAIGAFAQAATAIERFQKGQVLFKDLSPEIQELIPVINQFKSSWAGFVQQTRGPIFDLAIQGMNVIKSYLPSLVPVINTVTGALKGVLTSFDTPSPEFTRFLDTIKNDAPAAITSLTNIVQNLGNGFLSLFSNFSGGGQIILGTIESLTEKFREWSASMEKSEGFQNAIDYIKDNGPTVIKMIGDIVVTVGNLVAALGPIGAVAITLVQGFTALLAAIPVPALMVLSGVLAVVGIRMALVRLSTIGLFAPLAAARTAFLATGSASMAASVGLNAFKFALRGMLAATGVGLALVALSFALEGVMSSTDDAVVSTDAFTLSQNGLAKAARDVNGALTEQGKLDALNDLKESGTTAAGTAAGISPEELTKAYIGGPDSFKKLINTQKARRDQLIKIRADMSPEVHPDKIEDYGDPELTKQINDQRTFIDAGEKLHAELKSGVKTQAEYDAGLKALGLSAKGAAGDTNTLIDTFNRLTSVEQDDMVIRKHSTEVMKGYKDAVNTVTGAKKKYDDTMHSIAESEHDAEEAVHDAKEGLKDANKAVVDAQKAATDAEKKHKESLVDISKLERQVARDVRDLVEAREEARRQIRDSFDEEESLSIRRARADEKMLQTSGLGADSLERREAVLEHKNAYEDSGDTVADNAELRRKGVEGSDIVVGAKDKLVDDRKALDDARKISIQLAKDIKPLEDKVTEARHNQKEAIHDVTEAEWAYDKALRDGKIERQEALDLMIESKAAADEFNKSLSAFDRKFVAEIKVNKGSTEKDLKTVQTYLEAIRISATDSTIDAATAWTMAEKNLAARSRGDVQAASKINPHGNQGFKRFDSATGGAIKGIGSGTSDSIHAMVSKDEHIWTAAEVAAAGGHKNVAALRSAAIGGNVQEVASKKYARGGPVNIAGPTIDLKGMRLGDRMMTSLGKVASTQGAFSMDRTAGQTGGENTTNFALKGVKSWVRAAGNLIGNMFGIKNIGGYTSSGSVATSDHPKGLALDFMTNNLGKPKVSHPAGQRIADYIQANADALNVTYQIWNKKIWNSARQKEGWRNYSGPSDHTNHVHASFKANAKGLGRLSGASGLGGGILPGGGIAMSANSRLIAFGKMLQGKGFDVDEGPGPFGPVTGGHSRTSRHYAHPAAAIDVNKGAGTSRKEQGYLDAIVPLAKDYGLRSWWRKPGHFNHAHFDYPAGAGKEKISGGDGSSPTGDLPTSVRGLKKYFLGGGGANVGRGGGKGKGGSALGSKAITTLAEATARNVGASNKQLLSLFETGYAESGMKNYANRKVPRSMKIPHDAVGSDHDSVGYLQQRVGRSGKGAGWGTVEEAMNVSHATKAFLSAARQKDRNGLSAAALAQKVQVSAYPDAYGRQRARAYKALNREAPGIPAGIYDTGGILRPGHAALNLGGGGNETIRNEKQESALALKDDGMRKLAAYIAQALQTRPGEIKLRGDVVGDLATESIADILRLPGGF